MLGGQLMKCSQKAVDVPRNDPLQSVILKVHKQEVLAMGFAGTDQFISRMEHEAGFAGSSRSDNSRDEGVRSQIWSLRSWRQSSCLPVSRPGATVMNCLWA